MSNGTYRVWTGPPPKVCENCEQKITDTFYDAVIEGAHWVFGLH